MTGLAGEARRVPPMEGRISAGGGGPKRGGIDGAGTETEATKVWAAAAAPAGAGVATSGRDVTRGGAWPGARNPHSHLQRSLGQLLCPDDGARGREKGAMTHHRSRLGGTSHSG